MERAGAFTAVSGRGMMAVGALGVTAALLTSAVRSVDGDSRRVFALSPLGRAVAAAEAARLSDQVLAARSLRLFKGSGARVAR